MYSFKNYVANIMKNKNVQYIEIHADNKEDYYRIIDELTEFTDNSITISGTSKDPLNVIIEKLQCEIASSVGNGEIFGENPV